MRQDDDPADRRSTALATLRAPPPRKEVITMYVLRTHRPAMAGYVCRGCGTVCYNKGAFIRCPVCGIKWS